VVRADEKHEEQRWGVRFLTSASGTKRLELLRQLMPHAVAIAMLVDVNHPAVHPRWFHVAGCVAFLTTCAGNLEHLDERPTRSAIRSQVRAISSSRLRSFSAETMRAVWRHLSASCRYSSTVLL